MLLNVLPVFDNKVQITAVKNIGEKEGYNSRKWDKHGKLPYITYKSTSKLPASVPTTQPSYSIGDIVDFTGNINYPSSTTTMGSSCKPGIAKTTNIAKGAKHPYHVIKENDSTSTVYGWVDASDITGIGITSEAAVKIGDVVQFKGSSVYVSSSATRASAVRGASRCKVTAMSSDGKHTIHLVSEDGKGVYGWVDSVNVIK